MSQNLKAMTLTLAGLFLLAGSAFAQVSAIEGDIKGPDGQPIKGAVVKMERKDIKGMYTTKSDKKGHYGHYGLPLGLYKVTVEIDGQVRDSVDNVRTGLGEPKVVPFDLHDQQKKQQELAKAVETGTLTKEQERGMTAEQKAAFKKANDAKEATLKKNKELNDLFNAGKTALEAKQYDAAVESLTKAADMDPSQHVIWAQLADAYMKSAKAKPTEADALRQKGLDAYKKAIELSPADAAYYNNYALALVEAKKIPEAQEALQKAAQLDPAGAGRYYYNLGAVFTNANQSDAAVAAFKKAIEVDPNYADAHYQYGITLLSKVTLDKDGKQIPAPGTKEEFETYLRLAPNGPNAESAKAMLAAFDTTIATKYVSPEAETNTKKKKK